MMDDEQLLIAGALQETRRREAAAAELASAETAGTAAYLHGDTQTAVQTALLLALGKDGLDWVLDFMLIGEIPVVGQVPGILISMVILYYLHTHGLRGRSKKSAGAIAATILIDNLPLINNLPFGSIAVFIAKQLAERNAEKSV